MGGKNEHFPVRKSDVESNPHLFEPFDVAPAPQPQAVHVANPVTPLTPPAPRPLTVEASPLDFSGFSASIQKQLADASLTTREAIWEMGEKGLTSLKGIGPTTARKIMELVE